MWLSKASQFSPIYTAVHSISLTLIVASLAPKCNANGKKFPLSQFSANLLIFRGILAAWAQELYKLLIGIEADMHRG